MSEFDAKAAATLFDRRQLTLARHSAGLNKAELARRLQLSPASITQFENGSSRPSPAVLSRLSLALEFPLRFFSIDAAEHDDDASSDEAFFRSLRSTPLSERQKAVAYARLFYRLSSVLERRVVMPDVDIPVVPRLGLDASREQVEDAASAVRSAWEIPSGPIRNVVRVLEAHGVLVMRSDFGSLRVDAFSKRFLRRPVVVLSDDKADGARSRFDAAHELGHLVIHADEDPGNARLERQANHFAASFLMPAKEILRHLPSRIDWNHYIELKRSWGVSIGALLYRARDLGVISPTVYQRAMVKMSSLGWRTSEPGPRFDVESPILLTRAMEALAPLGYSVAHLEKESCVPSRMVEAALRSLARATVSMST